MTRAYTVAEIDELREVVKDKWLWGRYSGRKYNCDNFAMSRPYYESELTVYVEEQTRTWMMAGKTAKDLKDSEA